MSGRLAIAIAGGEGSGKSTLANHMAEKYGFTLFEGSIKSTAASEGFRLADRSSYDAFNRLSQMKHGKSWLSDITLSDPADRVLQVGIRNKADVYNFKRVGGLIIALVCPPETSFTRVDKNNPKQSSTLEEFIEANAEHEDEYGFGASTQWAVRSATVGIDASKSLDHVARAADQLVEQFSGQQM